MASLNVADADAMKRLGARLGERLGVLRVETAFTVGLIGTLGAGKTTLVQGIFQGLGHTGRVKSPTYTLIEPYRVDGLDVHHIDLYRLDDPEELNYLGLEDLLDRPGLVFIEWPERAPILEKLMDLAIDIEFRNNGRRVGLRPQSPEAAGFSEESFSLSSI